MRVISMLLVVSLVWMFTQQTCDAAGRFGIFNRGSSCQGGSCNVNASNSAQHAPAAQPQACASQMQHGNVQGSCDSRSRNAESGRFRLFKGARGHRGCR